jgi:glycosyltransferase involved in cell wall biosynthesis
MAQGNVTVVVPTRGDEAALRRISRNVAGVVPGASLIIILNRSAQAPQELRADILNCHPDASFFSCPGGGVSRARNLALRVAETDVVVFFDDDVIPTESATELLVSRLQGSAAGVATGRVLPAPTTAPASSIYETLLGLDRGSESRYFDNDSLKNISPMTSWGLGVGAAFAVRRSVVDRGTPSPYFDEALSNGRFCGGAEDIDFFLQCLHSDVPVIYCHDALFRHRYPVTHREIRAKVLQYSRADGAFYAKWKHTLHWQDLARDLSGWSARAARGLALKARGKPHVLLWPLFREPMDKVVGAAWWQLSGSR